MRIEVLSSIDQVDPARWDALHAAAGAPAFYSHAFLAAFERFPLHRVDAQAYVVGVEPDGSFRCGLPLYLQRGVDPMRVLDGFFPASADEPLLLSHVWHCYQGAAPVLRPDAETWDRVLAGVGDVADRLGARRFGFLNVEDGGALEDALEARDFDRAEIDRKFSLELDQVGDFAGYLDRLGSSARSSIRRYERIADDAGIELRTLAPADADLDRLLLLARATAAKFDNAGYYEPGRFQRFLRNLGSSARIVEMRHDGQLICSTILLVDEHRVHFWVCATDPEIVNRFSPFRLALMEALRLALARGARTLEVGRRNEQFKQRHGMCPAPLLAFLSPPID